MAAGSQGGRQTEEAAGGGGGGGGGGGEGAAPVPHPPHAGDWLHAAPILALGLHLQPLEFVLAASYRLGLPLYRVEGASPTCPACHQPADIYGIHTMNCGTGGERIHRHTLLVDVVHQVAAAAQLAPRKEVRFLIPGRDSRPALLPGMS